MAFQPIPRHDRDDLQLMIGTGTIRWHPALGHPKRPFADAFSIILAMKQEIRDDNISGFRTLKSPQLMASVVEVSGNLGEFGVDFATRILSAGTEYILTVKFAEDLDWPVPLLSPVPNPAVLPFIVRGTEGFTMGEGVHKFRPIRVASRMFP